MNGADEAKYIMQAAGSCGAEVLYSEDLADGQSFGDVRVINPLK